MRWTRWTWWCGVLVLGLAVTPACSDGSDDDPSDGAQPDAAASDAGPLEDAAGDAEAAADAAGPALRFEVVKPAERDARWAGARCNDGTPFAAYVRLNPASPIWVINFEGGVGCDDNALSCAQRLIDDPDLTTTIPVPDGTLVVGPGRGALSRDPVSNPDFAGANQVQAHYCSSDFWSGSTTTRRPTTGDPVRGWFFSGHSNAAALIELLRQRYGLDDSRPDLRVLLMGNSAGAHGAHFNARMVATHLPRTTAAGRLRLFLDAGWMFDWAEPAYPIINTTTTDREVWRNARNFWASRLDPVCEAAVTDPIDCWFGLGWYPHIRALMPVFLQQSRRDSRIGGFLHGPNLDYALWQSAADASLVGVDWLWSGANVYHVLSISDPGWHTGVAPNTLQQAVGRFWAGGAPERILF
ncbi:MAG: hypothetical protein IT370_30005 [Deltaproteobacteria bacterium]|nr:hypothetical protein [Deltaproteobacteria bacterium]